MDSVHLSLLIDQFTYIPEEMGYVLQRSAYSPNIKERMDASCAIFDEEGRLLSQAEHVPVHLGAMPVAVRAILQEFEDHLGPEQQFIVNDPYNGGTHLPDITVIKPVFRSDQLLGFCANRAHHADVGSGVPGSFPPASTDLSDEGVVIPPTALIRGEEFNEQIKRKVQNRMRNPEERLGDLRAQVGANRRGATRLNELAKRLGLKKFRNYGRQFCEYSSRRVRESIEEIPDGTFSSEEVLEYMEGEDSIHIRCTVQIQGAEITIDFSGTDSEMDGNLNAPEAVTLSSVYYVIRCLTDQTAPLNAGCYEMIDVHVPEGTFLNPRNPRAVCSGNVETSQRIVDVLLEAFRKCCPEVIPAQSQGTMNNLVISTRTEEEELTYYETIGGGEGAFPYRDGQSGIHTHMTNTKNTPVEALEQAYPFRVQQYKFRTDSGGHGKYRGGDGLIREVRLLKPGECTVVSERREISPSGADGGKPGAKGKNELVRSNGETVRLGARWHGTMEVGEAIRISTPGGGGYGSGESETI